MQAMCDHGDAVLLQVCFLCMRTRFGLFTRATKCGMCSQLVCSKCFAKVSPCSHNTASTKLLQMRIPLDHFSSVPVFALSPQSPLSPEPGEAPPPNQTSGAPSLGSVIRDKMSSVLSPDLSMFYSAASAGSAPTSPATRRRPEGSRPASSASAGPGAHCSLPVFTSQGPSVSR